MGKIWAIELPIEQVDFFRIKNRNDKFSWANRIILIDWGRAP